MKQVTLCYLVKTQAGRPEEVCLAEKKSGYVAGMLNTAGGKAKPGENPRDTALRELLEEQNVTADPTHLQNVAVLEFCFPESPEKDLECHVFFADQWQGDPCASDELGPPSWYPVERLPYDRMPPADQHWFPRVLTGERIRMRFRLDNHYHVAPSDVQFKGLL